MGADVTHPAPGEIGRKPSIAAVVGSTDPAISKFRVEVRVQASKDSSKEGTNVIEQILDMELCTYNLLKKFHDINNGRKPERIIFYRYSHFASSTCIKNLLAISSFFQGWSFGGPISDSPKQGAVSNPKSLQKAKPGIPPGHHFFRGTKASQDEAVP